MQIKISMSDHYTPTRTAIIKKRQTMSSGDDVEQLEVSYTIGGKAKWCVHFGKQGDRF